MPTKTKTYRVCREVVHSIGRPRVEWTVRDSEDKLIVTAYDETTAKMVARVLNGEGK